MSIKYACFISYPHYNGEIMKIFIKQIKKELENALGFFINEEIYQDIYHLKHDTSDEDLPKKLGQAICESVSWIIIFSPIYEERIWCLREFMAMEQIENKRKQLLGKKYDRTRRMIFPIILRGNLDELPVKIKGIHFYDFNKFSLSQLTIPKDDKKIIKSIAEDISTHYRYLKDLNDYKINDECNKFILPSIEQMENWWIKSDKKFTPFPGLAKVD